MAVPTTRHALPQVDDGNTTWGSVSRNAWANLDLLLGPDDVHFVSPGFSALTGTPTDPRGHATIQDALDALSSSEDATVVIYPGFYEENLTITKSCNLIALRPAGHFYGGRSARIRGQATEQSPVITIDTPAGSYLRVGFSGIQFENIYAVDVGTSIIEKAYLCHISEAPTSYGAYASVINFTDCNFRMQTWGNLNRWRAGIWVDGWAQAWLERCTLFSGKYGGGSNDGRIIFPAYAKGNQANVKRALMHLDNCRCYQENPGTGLYEAAADYADLFAYFTSFVRSQGTGGGDAGYSINTATMPGIDSNDWPLVTRNLFGYDLVKA